MIGPTRPARSSSCPGPRSWPCAARRGPFPDPGRRRLVGASDRSRPTLLLRSARARGVLGPGDEPDPRPLPPPLLKSPPPFSTPPSRPIHADRGARSSVLLIARNRRLSRVEHQAIGPDGVLPTGRHRPRGAGSPVRGGTVLILIPPHPNQSHSLSRRRAQCLPFL